MLKIVYPVCCGVDVHKKFIVATIAATDKKNVTTYQTKKFRTFTNDLLLFKEWLYSNNCNIVCMESTGKYWIPVFNMLEDSCSITLANPKYIKNIPGKKTDKRDSLWIADLHKHGLVRGSFIPPISRVGVYIKPLLVQCANAAIKDKDCPYFYHRYQSIKKRRGHKRAIIAIARMLLTCAFNMLLRIEAFDASMYEGYLQSNDSKNASMFTGKH